MLAAAIVVPVAVVLAALLLACCCIRRRNLRRRRAAAATAQQEHDKDLEHGPLDPAYSADIGRVPDQLGRESQVCALEAAQHSTAWLSVCRARWQALGLVLHAAWHRAFVHLLREQAARHLCSKAGVLSQCATTQC